MITFLLADVDCDCLQCLLRQPWHNPSTSRK